MAISNVISRSFTGANLVMLSVVEETEPRDFQSRYFMFIKAVPSTKNDAGSKSYDHKAGITFKMEVEKALAMSFALEQYALGKGKVYDDNFGNFTIFADGSKSQYGGDSKKSLAVNYYTNTNTKKTNISIFTASDSTKIPFFMTPYEAFAMSSVLRFLAHECLRLEIAGPGVVVRRQIGNQKNNNNNTSSPPPKNQSNMNFMTNQQPAQQTQAVSQPNPVPSNTNKVTSDFAGFFSDSDLPF